VTTQVVLFSASINVQHLLLTQLLIFWDRRKRVKGHAKEQCVTCGVSSVYIRAEGFYPPSRYVLPRTDPHANSRSLSLTRTGITAPGRVRTKRWKVETRGTLPTDHIQNTQVVAGAPLTQLLAHREKQAISCTSQIRRNDKTER
jgi:hypothetical protein